MKISVLCKSIVRLLTSQWLKVISLKSCLVTNKNHANKLPFCLWKAVALNAVCNGSTGLTCSDRWLASLCSVTHSGHTQRSDNQVHSWHAQLRFKTLCNHYRNSTSSQEISCIRSWSYTAISFGTFHIYIYIYTQTKWSN